jgi:hypothetical protein
MMRRSTAGLVNAEMHPERRAAIWTRMEQLARGR